MTNVSIPKLNIIENSSTLAVSVPINLFMKLGFVSVNDPQGNLISGRATYYFQKGGSPVFIMSISISPFSEYIQFLS